MRTAPAVWRILRPAGCLALAAVSLAAYLGERRLWDPRGLPAAGPYLPSSTTEEEALRDEPANPYAWCAAAEAAASEDRFEQADYLIRRAQELGPREPSILMRAANFHFTHGDARAALESASRILAFVSHYDAIIFSYYRRFDIPADDVLAAGLPDSPRAWQSYFAHALTWAEPDRAAKIWAAAAARGYASRAEENHYVQYLLDRRRGREAISAWKGRPGVKYPVDNYIFNGSVEEELTGNAFDWNLAETQGVRLRRVSGDARQGNWALAVEFSGEHNVSYYQNVQTAWLPPGAYRFQVYARTLELTTDQGIYLRIADYEAPRRLYARTAQFTGTNDWTPAQADFSVGQGGALVRIQICRDASMKIDNKIRGVAWIDEASLRRR
ncbi:MAG: hypothetical protein KIT09_05275 [Bryobacteraceae bacterium]|nr:hypothetical protein [Bryobacteraceae bacterium]